MTEPVDDLLDFLHASGSGGADRATDRRQMGALVRKLNGMLDISSLDSLARTFHGHEPSPAPQATECNEILAAVDVSRVSTNLLVGLVRSTFPKRSLLPAWYGLRDSIRLEFTAREPKRWRALLNGLLEHKEPRKESDV